MKKVTDIITIVFLFAALLLGIYFLWLNFPKESVEFEDYKTNISQEFPEKSSQFYQNMRYPTEDIGYQFASRCGQKKRKDFEKAIARLERETIIKFHESNTPELTITCSRESP